MSGQTKVVSRPLVPGAATSVRIAHFDVINGVASEKAAAVINRSKLLTNVSFPFGKPVGFIMGVFSERYGGTIFLSWLNNSIHCGCLIENVDTRVWTSPQIKSQPVILLIKGFSPVYELLCYFYRYGMSLGLFLYWSGTDWGRINFHMLLHSRSRCTPRFTLFGPQLLLHLHFWCNCIIVCVSQGQMRKRLMSFCAD